MQNFRKLLTVILPFILFYCSSNNDGGNEIMEISFPLNKKAVYASCYYADFGDSLALQFVQISSLMFDTESTEGEAKYLSGTIAINNDLNNAAIFVSIKDNWLLFEHSNFIEAGYIFLKTSTTDTTDLPDELHQHFPIVPQFLQPNHQYSILRPGNEGYEWGYLDVFRVFNAKEETTWSDYYDENAGIEVTINHHLLFTDLEINTVFDQHGLVNSQYSLISYNINVGDLLPDSTLMHVVNRRIVDFSDEADVSSLESYSQLVMENGLTVQR